MVFAIVAICVIGAAIAGLVVFNSIVNAKLRKMEKEEVEKKETALKEKLGKTDEPKEEPNEEPTEEVEEAKEEEAEEPVEEKEEQPEEKEEEPAEEQAEEPAEEEKVEEPKEEEKVEEQPEEKVEEPVEEKAEEPKKDKKAEKKAKKAEKKAKKEEPKEEPKEEKQEDVEELLKDVPEATDTVEEKPEEKVEETAATEPVEEVKEEPKEEKVEEPKKAPAKKAAKKAPAKKAVVAPVPAPKKAPGKKAEKVEKEMADGKWYLVPDNEGYYYGRLHANNGQKILETEKYKGVAGIKGGIETIGKNIEKDNFEISVDKNDTANFKLFGSNMGLLCIGEGYGSKESALSAIESVKHFFNSPQIVVEETEESEVKQYSIEESEKNPNGKWLIVNTDDGYLHAELKANNGQVLLVTENYKGINSLKSGLTSLKENIQTGNFSTKKDKNENYNFKLLAKNKRLLALGAGYSTLASCESAISSVMRFCDSPVINADGTTDEQ